VSAAALLGFLCAALGVAGAGLAAGTLTHAWVAGRRRAAGGDRGGRLRLLRLLIRAGGRLGTGGTGAPRDLDARIVAAGRPGGVGTRELMAAKTAAALVGGLAAALLFAAAPGRLGLVPVVVGPTAGFLAPDLWLLRRARERSRRVRRELPALLDLLRLSIEAGRSLPTALGEVGARARGPLAGEWRIVAREVTLGVPLDHALQGMVRRAPLPEVRALVAALDRARRHGAPLAETLAAQSRDARFALARRAREEAARAGPKIQLVVALLLVPSVLLLVAAALVAALMSEGTGGGSVLPI
jgi:tight adherence protein C